MNREPAKPEAATAPARLGDAAARLVLDAAPDAVVVADAEGRVVFANVHAERMFGYARGELLGGQLETLVPERARSSVTVCRARLATEPCVEPLSFALELYGVRRDGAEFPIELGLSAVAQAARPWIVASLRNLASRGPREHEMQGMQQQLLSAVESIQGAFAIFDADDKLVLCNSTYRATWGGNVPGEITGHTFQELLDSHLDIYDCGERTLAVFREICLAYHRDPVGMLELRLKDGRSARKFARRTAEHGTVVTIMDVTDEVLHEAELQHAYALAEAASSAKSEFLASMSHELRTPLNAILGFAQLLQRDKKTPLSERQRERIGHVLKGGEHLLRLIDDILDLARIEAGRVSVSLEPVSVGEVLVEVKATLDPMAAHAEIAIELAELPAALPEVLADRTRFKQVLMNFGSNAIKYGRPHGHLRLSVQREDGFVRITVADDGIGIAADKRDKMWMPFHRAGQETGPIEGTGIGLAITKRLAEVMNARVGFRSTEGQGSAFWIELPVYVASVETQANPPPDALPRREDAALGGESVARACIVYIEDNPSNIAFMQDVVADFEQVELITAPTAEIGLPLVRARLPHVVIMDINLPGMSGLEATCKLRDWPETAHIPIIGLSAAAMVRDAARVSEVGFYRYLTKPVKLDELTAVLTELLSRSRSALPPGSP